MANTNTKASFKLSWKIGIGFAVTLLLLCTVAGLGYRAMSGTQTRFEKYRSVARSNNLLGRIQANLLEARTSAMKYVTSAKPSDAEEFEKRVVSIHELVAEAGSIVSNTEDEQRIQKIDKDVITYAQAFDQVVTLVAERNRLLVEVFRVEGAVAVNELTRVIESAEDAQRTETDMAKVKAAGEICFTTSEAARHLLGARLGIMSYLADFDEKHLPGVKENFEELTEQLHELKPLTEGTPWADSIATATAAMQRYEAGWVKAEAATKKQEDLFKNVMSKVGPQVAADIEQLTQSNRKTQDTLGPQIVSANVAAIWQIAVVSVIAIAVGVLTALFITRLIVKPINAVVTMLKDIAQGEGDLTRRIEVTSRDEIGELATWFNTFVAKIQVTVREVMSSAREVASAATQIAASSEEMTQGMHEQTSQTTQVSSAVEEMSASIVEVARKSADAAGHANDAGRKATEGGEVVNQSVQGIHEIADMVNQSAIAISELGKRSEQIGDVINVINDIADQTNLLALNAAIEAARAGEHGRGFAVVADEVRKLADRTTKATEEIATSIKLMQNETRGAVERMETGTSKVDEGVTLGQSAGESLQTIVAGARTVADMIQSIAAAAEQQSAAAEEISRSVESIAAVTQQSTQGAEQAAAAASQLSLKSEQLQHLVSQFRV